MISIFKKKGSNAKCVLNITKQIKRERKSERNTFNWPLDVKISKLFKGGHSIEIEKKKHKNHVILSESTTFLKWEKTKIITRNRFGMAVNAENHSFFHPFVVVGCLAFVIV